MQIHGANRGSRTDQQNTIHSAEAIQGLHAARAARNGQAHTAAREIYPADRVEISDVARFTLQTKNLPDVRSDRVAEAKAKIASGYYDSPQVLEETVSKLLGELA